MTTASLVVISSRAIADDADCGAKIVNGATE
jgi:hypothetical protein